MLVEGTIAPINVINSNGWGISENDVKSIIEGIQSNPLRASIDRKNEHLQDFTGDPQSEIGNFTKVYRGVDPKTGKDSIRAIADIKDGVAIRKLRDGVWNPKWSIAGFGKKLENGLTNGYNTIGVSLVKQGAWDDASFKTYAASLGHTDVEVFVTNNDFKILTASDGDGNMPKENELKKQIDDLKALVASKDTEIKNLVESNTKLETKVDDTIKGVEDFKTKLMASFEDKPGDADSTETKPESISEDKVSALIASAINDYTVSMKRKESLDNYLKLAASAEMKIPEDQLKMIASLSSEQIDTMAKPLEIMVASKNSQAGFPSYFGSENPDSSEYELSVGGFTGNNVKDNSWETDIDKI